VSDQPETPPAETAAGSASPSPAAPAPRPAAPGAAAASRARRIGGGRPAPGPAAGARPPVAGGTEAAEDVEVAGGTVQLTKPAEPAVEPAESAGPPAGLPTGRPPLPIGDGVPPSVPAWLNWAPAGVLVAGCVVMAVLITIFSHGVWWGPDRAAPPSPSKVAQQREQVLAAAKSCAVAANDYDYRTLAAYEKKALACTTGGLTSQLKQTIESLIMKNAPTLKAKQVTQISRGGIETVTPDGKQWTLLLFGQLSVVNAKEPNGRVDPFAAQVRMEKAHGKWVMSKLTVVSLPISSGN